MPAKTKRIAFNKYANGKWIRTVATNDNGTEVYDEEFFKLSLEVQKVEALKKIADSLPVIEFYIARIASRLPNPETPPDPKKVAAAEKAKREAESLKRATAVWLKACGSAVGSATTTVQDAGLSVRARGVARRLGFVSLNQFAALSEEELLEQKNCGMTTVNEIKAKLAEHGLTLADSPFTGA
jgi:hypothetical protein